MQISFGYSHRNVKRPTQPLCRICVNKKCWRSFDFLRKINLVIVSDFLLRTELREESRYFVSEYVDHGVARRSAKRFTENTK